jgi:hypothetical protein
MKAEQTARPLVQAGLQPMMAEVVKLNEGKKEKSTRAAKKLAVF